MLYSDMSTVQQLNAAALLWRLLRLLTVLLLVVMPPQCLQSALAVKYDQSSASAFSSLYSTAQVVVSQTRATAVSVQHKQLLGLTFFPQILPFPLLVRVCLLHRHRYTIHPEW